ncbi:hypothetical protein BMF94_5312 [Rhodotorula taiwanensis]|uniref:LPPG:FO 2-phospho-L-lactate transferase CofD/UPF0052 n=1 Tax=Rhodotorula taiwanensis TaxID=741276 RepID=A0A2S5B4A7_9BASI|nr:hypothetical protein BMF94_5312 [Rhodotorula taiwanensis]
MAEADSTPSTPRLAAAHQPRPTPPATATDLDALLAIQDFCIIGGGTGCNAVVGAFAGAKRISYCLPVSDDGGSSSEIQRVLGGPALGDLRSRLVRLIPPSRANSPLDCIRRLLEYRLPGGPTVSHSAVKQEWGDIVEGTHRLWRGIPGDRKETIRAFLVHFQSAVLKKAQRGFNFKKASIGNLFLSGASLFLGSVPSAVFLFQSVTAISHDSIRIIPVINTSSTVTIAAQLEDGTIIAGQSEISHPSVSSAGVAAPVVGVQEPVHGAEQDATAPLLVNGQTHHGTGLVAPLAVRTEAIFPLTRATTPSFPEPPVLGAEEDESHADLPPSPDLSLHLSTATDATGSEVGPYSPSGLTSFSANQSHNLEFTKDASAIPPLPSRIQRIFYLSTYGLEIHPRPNSTFLQAIQDATTLIFAPGSLYTSIVPCLILRPVGDLIRTTKRVRHKILLLNASEDRETTGYDAVDFVVAIQEACRASRLVGAASDSNDVPPLEPSDIVTHVVYVRNGLIRVDEQELRGLGIEPIPVGPTPEGLFNDEVVRDALAQILST